MPYQIPPWIQPADEAGHFMRAYQAGASVQEARNRLDEQAQLASMEMQAKQAQLDIDNKRNQQRLMIDQAYNQAHLNLEKGRLEQTQKSNELRATIAAKKFAAQQSYRDAIAGGEDPAKALLTYGGAMGTPMAGLGQALKESRMEKAQIPDPQVIESMGERAWKVPKPEGGYELKPITKRDAQDRLTDREKLQVKLLQQEKASLMKDTVYRMLETMGDKAPSGNKEQAAGLKLHHDQVSARIQKIDEALQRMSTRSGGDDEEGVDEEPPDAAGVPAANAQPSAGPQVLPFPSSKKEAVKGQIYQTKLGPMMWDGEKFVAVKIPSASQVPPPMVRKAPNLSMLGPQLPSWLARAGQYIGATVPGRLVADNL